MSNIELYDVGQLLGRGGFATVYRARNRVTSLEVAIKVIEKSKICEPSMISRVNGEIRIHAQMHHPSIVSVVDCFEDESLVYIVLELCSNGNLYKNLKTFGAKSEAESAVITCQILRGVQHIHDMGVIHRDLKMSNILLDEKQNVKICDFGLSVQLEHPDEEHFTLCGTPNYIAPEIITNKSYSYPVDIWSIGCIFYSLVTGSPPFECHQGSDVKEVLNRIVEGYYEIPQKLSLSGLNFLQSLLELDPLMRKSCHELLNHPFLQHAISGSGSGGKTACKEAHIDGNGLNLNAGGMTAHVTRDPMRTTTTRDAIRTTASTMVDMQESPGGGRGGGMKRLVHEEIPLESSAIESVIDSNLDGGDRRPTPLKASKAKEVLPSAPSSISVASTLVLPFPSARQDQDMSECECSGSGACDSSQVTRDMNTNYVVVVDDYNSDSINNPGNNRDRNHNGHSNRQCSGVQNVDSYQIIQGNIDHSDNSRDMQHSSPIRKRKPTPPSSKPPANANAHLSPETLVNPSPLSSDVFSDERYGSRSASVKVGIQSALEIVHASSKHENSNSRYGSVPERSEEVWDEEEERKAYQDSNAYDGSGMSPATGWMHYESRPLSQSQSHSPAIASRPSLSDHHQYRQYCPDKQDVQFASRMDAPPRNVLSRSLDSDILYNGTAHRSRDVPQQSSSYLHAHNMNEVAKDNRTRSSPAMDRAITRSMSSLPSPPSSPLLRHPSVGATRGIHGIVHTPPMDPTLTHGLRRNSVEWSPRHFTAGYDSVNSSFASSMHRNEVSPRHSHSHSHSHQSVTSSTNSLYQEYLSMSSCVTEDELRKDEQVGRYRRNNYLGYNDTESVMTSSPISHVGGSESYGVVNHQKYRNTKDNHDKNVIPQVYFWIPPKRHTIATTSIKSQESEASNFNILRNIFFNTKKNEILLISTKGNILFCTYIRDKSGKERPCRVCMYESDPMRLHVGKIDKNMLNEIKMLQSIFIHSESRTNYSSKDEVENSCEVNGIFDLNTNKRTASSPLTSVNSSVQVLKLMNANHASRLSEQYGGEGLGRGLDDADMHGSREGKVTSVLESGGDHPNASKGNTASYSCIDDNSTRLFSKDLYISKYHIGKEMPGAIAKVYLRVYHMLEVIKVKIPRVIVYVTNNVSSKNNHRNDTNHSNSGSRSTNKSSSQHPQVSSPPSSLPFSSQQTGTGDDYCTLPACKCTLMSNTPLPDFCIKWKNGMYLKYSLSKGNVSFKDTKSKQSFIWSGNKELHWTTCVPSSIHMYIRAAYELMEKCIALNECIHDFDCSGSHGTRTREHTSVNVGRAKHAKGVERDGDMPLKITSLPYITVIDISELNNNM